MVTGSQVRKQDKKNSQVCYVLLNCFTILWQRRPRSQLSKVEVRIRLTLLKRINFYASCRMYFLRDFFFLKLFPFMLKILSSLKITSLPIICLRAEIS
jgi:hypothetical protein